jgi:DNA repair protein RecO (recombination protein O)
MPGLYRDEGIVLRTIKLGEADRIVTLYTRENGKVRAVAKGIRKTKSRFGGRLEPFSRVDLLVYRGRGSLDTITQAHTMRPFGDVRGVYSLLTSGAALVEIVEKMTEERERSFPTYALLVAGLEALASGRTGNVVPAFLVKLLSISGYHPQLRSCAGCGSTAGLAAFSPALGGVACPACARSDRSSTRFAPDRVALLGRLLSSDFGQDSAQAVTQDVTLTLRDYAEYHLERPLKSIKFLQAI